MRYLITLLPLILLSDISHGQKKEYKKSVGITISLPWINNYTYYDYGENKSQSKTGLTGIGASLFYKTCKNKYSLNGGLTTTFNFNFEKGGGITENVQFLEGIIHHNFYEGFNGIYGINFSNYTYITTGPDAPGVPEGYSKKYQTIGLTFGREYMFSKTFALALFYRPALYSFETKSYKHNISLDASFDIRFWRK